MRLHAKVAANASGAFMGRFPTLPCEIDELCDDKGGIDVGKVRSALREYDELITWSAKDDVGTIALTLEFMRQMTNSVKELEKDVANDVRTTVDNATDRILERRMDKGKFASCRLDFDRSNGHLRVRMSYANPKDVVGAMDKSCRKFLLHCARILRNMTKHLAESGVRVVLMGLGEVSDIFAEAEYADAKCDAEKLVEETNAMRIACKKRIGDYCSPVTPDCPCFNCGKCIEAKLDDKWTCSWEGESK